MVGLGLRSQNQSYFSRWMGLQVSEIFFLREGVEGGEGGEGGGGGELPLASMKW